MPLPSIRTVLVYSHGEVIGDGVIKLPWVGGLRAAFQGARITWCAASGETVYATTLAPLAQALIDEIVSEPDLAAGRLRPWGRRPFGGRRFDLVIDTQSDPRQTLPLRRAASGLFISATAAFLFSDRRPTGPAPPTIGERVGRLFSLAAGRPVPPVAPWAGDAPARQAAETLLPAGPVYIGLAPGSGGREKRWPLERYIELGRRQADLGRQPVFLLGPAEAGDAPAIRSALPSATIPDLSGGEGVSGPRVLVALASRLAAAMANDAGPGHMLAAGGAPLVSLQRSARTAAKFRPATPRLELVVARDLDMATIAVDEAEAALERLLRPGAG